MRTQHKSLTPANTITSHVCDHCGTSFRHKHNLVKHKKEVHGKEKSFECKRCSEKFNLYKDLKMHITTCNVSCVINLKCKESDHGLVRSPSIFRVIPYLIKSIP